MNSTDLRDFPPFYTLQRVETTRARQLDLWTKLVLREGLPNGQSTFSIDISSFLPFSNPKISRAMDMEGRRAVGDALVQSQNAKWEDVSKTRLLLSARTIDAWAAVIYSWAGETGRIGGSPSTVYEIYSGEDSESTELYNLHPDVCLKALQALQKQGKAIIIQGDSVDSTGVKFI